MSILAVASELGDFGQAGTPIVSTTGTYHDAALSRCAVGVNGLGDQIFLNFADASTIYASFNIGIASNFCLQNWPSMSLGSGTSVLCRLLTVSTNNAQRYFQYWNGSSFVTVGTVTLPVGTYARYTIAAKIAVSGFIRLYSGGSILFSFEGDTTGFGFTTLNRWDFLYVENNNATYVSEVIIADEDITAMRLATITPSANGANTAWTGDYTAVDEIGRDPSDIIYSATADQKETYAMNDISVGNRTVRALVISPIIRRGLTGPQNAQAVARVGTTDHDVGAFNLSTNSECHQVVSETNPATSQRWTSTEINAAELGLRSIT